MDKICYLCKSKEKDEVKFGEFMTRGKISVHYFCLLLSSNLMQNGQDNEGLLGFLPKDIQEEANRVKPLICCYCRKPSANISCCASRCYKSFHLTCGEKNSTEHNFVGTFQSFCHRHVKGKKVTQPLPDEKCCICYDNILDPGKRFDTVNMIRAPCCKNGWFHKYCLAAFAKTAGYFFKCPLCNDSKVFRQRLAFKSIFIPDRDAAWELEPNAFAELLERPNSCSAENCCAEGGRTSQTKRNEFIFCSTCGSVAIHPRCMTIQAKNFFCDECTSLTAAINSSSVVNISASQQNNNSEDDEDEDEDIDVGDDFDVGSLNNSGPSNESEEDRSNETIKPLGLGLKRSVLDNSASDGESNAEATCNFYKEDSNDGNSEIIQHLTIKTDKYKIVDYTFSDSELDDEVISNRKTLKRTNRILSNESLDIQNTSTSCKRQKRINSSETESLFDSGAESDRSGSSGSKCNSKSSLENSTNNFYQKSDHKVVVQVKKLKNLEIGKRGNRRFISLNDGTNALTIKNKPKRSKSESKGTYFNSSEKKLDGVFSVDNKEENFEGTSERILELKIERLNNEYEEQDPPPVLQNHVSFLLDKETKILSTYNSNSSEVDVPKPAPTITKVSPMRLRSRSEDFSKRAPRVCRRRSCVPSSLEKLTETQTFKRPSESLESGSSKRSCLDYITGNERCVPTENKNMTSCYKNENKYTKSGIKMRPPRVRSPPFTNISDLYAYMAPPYIKKAQQFVADTTSTAEEQPIGSEEGNVCIKNKPKNSRRSEFPLSKNLEQAKLEVHVVHANVEAEVKTNKNGSAIETSCNGYDNLCATDKSKIKKNKIKRIPSQKSPKGVIILPSNQTKIESFFKRI